MAFAGGGPIGTGGYGGNLGSKTGGGTGAAGAAKRTSSGPLSSSQAAAAYSAAKDRARTAQRLSGATLGGQVANQAAAMAAQAKYADENDIASQLNDSWFGRLGQGLLGVATGGMSSIGSLALRVGDALDSPLSDQDYRDRIQKAAAGGGSYTSDGGSSLGGGGGGYGGGPGGLGVGGSRGDDHYRGFDPRALRAALAAQAQRPATTPGWSGMPQFPGAAGSPAWSGAQGGAQGGPQGGAMNLPHWPYNLDTYNMLRSGSGLAPMGAQDFAARFAGGLYDPGSGRVVAGGNPQFSSGYPGPTGMSPMPVLPPYTPVKGSNYTPPPQYTTPYDWLNYGSLNGGF